MRLIFCTALSALAGCAVIAPMGGPPGNVGRTAQYTVPEPSWPTQGRRRTMAQSPIELSNFAAGQTYRICSLDAKPKWPGLQPVGDDGALIIRDKSNRQEARILVPHFSCVDFTGGTTLEIYHPCAKGTPKEDRLFVSCGNTDDLIVTYVWIENVESIPSGHVAHYWNSFTSKGPNNVTLFDYQWGPHEFITRSSAAKYEICTLGVQTVEVKSSPTAPWQPNQFEGCAVFELSHARTASNRVIGKYRRLN